MSTTLPVKAKEKKIGAKAKVQNLSFEETTMFPILIWIDSELYEILKQRHLDLGLVTKMAILSLKVEGMEPGTFEKRESGHYERMELSRYDFFTLTLISREKEVDPNVLLSYAFTEALLEILRL
ncbi:hypothetical protein [Leptospira terpstrae]|uniref:hypothetical protein n=1 Tax=Leptospira terpstrae TaxID=293075 RepID=UPI001E31DB8F|nr:hypothetical protein [Leptospira terpstrae]